MQWVADHVQYPAVVSASIAGANSAALNQAAESLVNDFGIIVVAAAGKYLLITTGSVDSQPL